MRALSLDEPVRHDFGSGRDRGSLGSVALQQVETRYDLVEYRESLGPLLNALPERERTILLLRFFDDLTQTEIGRRVGVSQMHVSRLLTRTLRTQLIGLRAPVALRPGERLPARIGRFLASIGSSSAPAPGLLVGVLRNTDGMGDGSGRCSTARRAVAPLLPNRP